MIIAVTGHRPDKLGGYDDATFEKLVRFAHDALNLMCPTAVITGMALGWDQAIASACVGQVGVFHAYVPFLGQESRWPREAQERYRDLLGHAYSTVVCSPGGYSAKAMQVRNERMVDDCDLLVSLWNGTEGGTANCVRYAQRRQRPVLNLWHFWENR